MTRNVRLVFLTNALILLLSVVTSLLSAWALGPEGRGDLAIVTVWLFAFSMAGSLGLPNANRFWAAREPEWHSQIFSNSLVYTLCAGGVMCVIGWMIMPSLTSGRTDEVIFYTRLFILNVPIILLTDMLRGQLEGARLFGWVSSARLSFIASQAAGYAVFYYFGWLTLENALWIIVAAQIICPMIMLAGILHRFRPSWEPRKKILSTAINYGMRGYFGHVTGYAILRLDQLVLALIAPNEMIGLYVVAVALAEITATLASSVADALMPEVAAGDRASSSLLLGKSLRLMFYANILGLIPLWIASPYILSLVYGESFVAATSTLRILLVASIVWGAALTVISGLDGLDNPGLSTLSRLASTAITIVALLLLIPPLGMVGAAAASLIGYSSLLIVATWLFIRRQRIEISDLIFPRRDDLSYAQIKALVQMPILRRAESKI